MKEFGFWALDQESVTGLASESPQRKENADAMEGRGQKAEQPSVPEVLAIDQTCSTGREADSTQKILQQNHKGCSNFVEKPAEDTQCQRELDDMGGEGKISSQKKGGWGSISNFWHGHGLKPPDMQQKSEVRQPRPMLKEPVAEAQDLGHIRFNGNAQGPCT